MPTGPPAPQDRPQVDKAAWRDGGGSRAECSAISAKAAGFQATPNGSLEALLSSLPKAPAPLFLTLAEAGELPDGCSLA